MDDNQDDDLASDIAYALWRSPFKVKKGQSIEFCRSVAREVVAHLRRCRWLFGRREPPKVH